MQVPSRENVGYAIMLSALYASATTELISTRCAWLFWIYSALLVAAGFVGVEHVGCRGDNPIFGGGTA